MQKKNSRLSGNLEPFQCLNIDFRGKSDMKSLVLAELLKFWRISVEVKIYIQLYINELINYLIAQADETVEIFDLYKKCIQI